MSLFSLAEKKNTLGNSLLRKRKTPIYFPFRNTMFKSTLAPFRRYSFHLLSLETSNGLLVEMKMMKVIFWAEWMLIVFHTIEITKRMNYAFGARFFFTVTRSLLQSTFSVWCLKRVTVWWLTRTKVFFGEWKLYSLKFFFCFACTQFFYSQSEWIKI